MNNLFVISAGVLSILFIWWFFFGKRNEAVEESDEEGRIKILVDGGYKPENIKIKKGVTTKLTFERKDANSCLEEIVIPDFKVKKFLPLNQKVEIELTPKKSGVFQTHCGMGMFHGRIIVE